MICDERTLCIAGVFGGKIQVFQSILLYLESAYFNPVSIRKTAKDTN
jgi:phenylalanyl-tRNA synthetase beta chain